MYHFKETTQYRRDVRSCKKKGFKMNRINEILIYISKNGTAPAINRPHKLKGNYIGHWECHIQPDWLLIWKKKPNKVISLIRTGSHSDLFK